MAIRAEHLALVADPPPSDAAADSANAAIDGRGKLISAANYAEKAGTPLAAHKLRAAALLVDEAVAELARGTAA